MTLKTNNCKGDGNHPDTHNIIASLLNSITDFTEWIKNEPNKETIINVYPAENGTREKIVFWKDTKNTIGNYRMFSIEAHGLNDTYHSELNFPLCHVTFYSSDQTGTTNKVLEWRWGENWDNLLHVYTNIQIDGTMRFGGKRTIPYHNSGGLKGDFCFDDDYLYICIENDLWKRLSISTW